MYIGITIPLRPLGDFSTRTMYITRKHKASLLYNKLMPVRYRVKCAAEARVRGDIQGDPGLHILAVLSYPSPSSFFRMDSKRT